MNADQGEGTKSSRRWYPVEKVEELQQEIKDLRSSLARQKKDNEKLRARLRRRRGAEEGIPDRRSLNVDEWRDRGYFGWSTTMGRG